MPNLQRKAVIGLLNSNLLPNAMPYLNKLTKMTVVPIHFSALPVIIH